MFWAQVLPFRITAALAGAAVLFHTCRGPAQRALRRCLTALAVTLLAFVPTCVAIDLALAPFRFRTFRYDTAAEITDERFLRYLPPEAKNLRIHRTGNGHVAVFTVTDEQLDDWYQRALERARGLPGAFSDTTPAVREVGGRSGWPMRVELFDELGWGLPHKLWCNCQTATESST